MTSMATRVLLVDPVRPEPAVIARAAAVLLGGGLVAFPTETVYGLGALADDAACVARIFAAKGRPAYNPLIAHVTDARMARALAAAWPDAAARLAEAFWPGPLTLVVPRDPARVPDAVTGGRDTVALRAPAHPVARALLAAVDRPIAAPSANRFQALSPTTAAHVLKGLDGAIDLILDGGPCPFGIESTVVDVTSDPPVLLRPGALSREALAVVLPGLRVHAGSAVEDGTALPSPGMLHKHYAPRARLATVPRAELQRALAEAGARGPAGAPVSALVGAVVRHPLGASETPAVRAKLLPDEPVAFGAALFAALHDLDDAGCATVLVEAVPEGAAWDAVRDRLARASSA